ALHVQVPLEAPPRDDSAAFDVHRRNLRALMFSAGFPIDAQAVRFQADNLARARFNSRPLSLTPGFVDRLPRLDAALVGIWGSEDATAGGATGILQRREIFRAAQPGCDFHILENTGHWAMYEAPDRVSDILLQG
ncbi:MAG: alpha/beta hydrolase, partial [Halieaceae bacterium]|nr:alpha/beta hydrolase [Halieaceae bacterium]